MRLRNGGILTASPANGMDVVLRPLNNGPLTMTHTAHLVEVVWLSESVSMKMTDTMARVALERSEDSLRKITTATILERPVELLFLSDQQSPRNVLACCEDSQAGTITTESLHDDTMITHPLESLSADTSESMTMSRYKSQAGLEMMALENTRNGSGSQDVVGTAVAQDRDPETVAAFVKR